MHPCPHLRCGVGYWSPPTPKGVERLQNGYKQMFPRDGSRGDEVGERRLTKSDSTARTSTSKEFCGERRSVSTLFRLELKFGFRPGLLLVGLSLSLAWSQQGSGPLKYQRLVYTTQYTLWSTRCTVYSTQNTACSIQYSTPSADQSESGGITFGVLAVEFAKEKVKTTLEPPSDGFMLVADYKKEVAKVINKAIGHRLHVQEGVAGVLLPARTIPVPPPPSLWRIRRELSTETKKSTLLAREQNLPDGEDDVGISVVDSGLAEAQAAITGRDFLKRMAASLPRSASSKGAGPDSDDETLLLMEGSVVKMEVHSRFGSILSCMAVEMALRLGWF